MTRRLKCWRCWVAWRRSLLSIAMRLQSISSTSRKPRHASIVTSLRLFPTLCPLFILVTSCFNCHRFPLASSWALEFSISSNNKWAHSLSNLYLLFHILTVIWSFTENRASAVVASCQGWDCAHAVASSLVSRKFNRDEGGGLLSEACGNGLACQSPAAHWQDLPRRRAVLRGPASLILWIFILFFVFLFFLIVSFLGLGN